MKKKYILLWILLLAIGFACSDDPVEDNTENPDKDKEEEVTPPLPDPVSTESRAMWVSYDPNPNAETFNSTGISPALISWRLFKTDPKSIAFDIYKSVDGGDEVKLNKDPIDQTTSWVDANIDPKVTNYYRVTLADKTETFCDYTFTPKMAENFYHEIKLNMNVPDPSLNYAPDDIQLGDIDGDGELEIIVKREPYDGANQGGWHSGTTLLEAYKMDGTFLWRIDMGVNIRSGSHYTSFVVYDFDGDGLCEVAFRSAEGTTFGDGKVITDENGKVNDYRIRESNSGGWYSGASLGSLHGLILEGPEYISICRGFDGREISRVDNIPRGGSGSKKEQAKHWVDYWGDDYGNRMDRFFIGVAFLDGVPDPVSGARVANPSLIISRGIYKNWEVRALDLKGGELVPKWEFDTADRDPKWQAQGFHFFRVADLDNDGRDEILFGSAAIDHDGSELWCNGNGHGDTMHVGKFIQNRSGLQIVAAYESPNDYNIKGHGYGAQVLDAATGNLITGHGPGSQSDVGRSIVADIDPDSPGFEYWSSLQEGVFSCATGTKVSDTYPTGIGGGVSYNAAIYWSGELTRELYDRACIVSFKDNPEINRSRLVYFGSYGANDGNHSTKYNPCYYGDFLGDYREEVILGSKEQNSILIFSTNHPAKYRFPHLMQDHHYDMQQSMQNMGYNQPTYLGYYLGAELGGE